MSERDRAGDVGLDATLAPDAPADDVGLDATLAPDAKDVGLDATLAPRPRTPSTLPGPGEPPRGHGGRTEGSLDSGRGRGSRPVIDPMSADTLPGPHQVADLPSLPRIDESSYAIGAELARGGMGMILSARDRRLRRDVVIKVTRGRDLDPRFEREAYITARLQHPSIVRVYEAGILGDGRAFYAMERVRGRSLEVVLSETKTLRDRIALLPHAIAVADAIAYAHSEGVLHRDLKPENVLIGPFGETVVIDWGLAKDLHADDSAASSRPRRAQPSSDASLTQVGSVMGTPSYMAPEQARGDASDERSDIYALGALLYALLSGTPPHHGRTTEEVLDLIAAGRRIPVAEREPGLPPELATIVEHAMALDPADRFTSAKELADELRRFAAGKLVARHNYSLWVLLRRWLWRHRVTVGVAAFAVAALAVIAVMAFRSIVHERQLAEDAQARAEVRRREADNAREEAHRAKNRVLYRLATEKLDADPSLAAAWISSMDDDALAWPRTTEIAHAIATRGLAYELVGHAADIEVVIASPDGRHVATASDDATIRVWDVSQRPAPAPRVLVGHVGAIETIVFSPDGTRIASAGTDGKVGLWNLSQIAEGAKATGRMMSGHTNTVRGVAFSPDGARLVSSGEDGTMWIWDVMTEAGAVFTRHVYGFRPVAWTRAGTIIVGGFDGTIGHFDAATGVGKVRPAHGAEVRCLALSPDQRYLAAGDENGDVVLWDVHGARLRTLGSHTDVARDLVFTPDGRHLISAGGNNVVNVYDLARGTMVALTGHTDGVKDLDLSADGKLVASAGIDGSVRVWPITGGDPRVFRGHRAAVKGIVFMPDGDLVSGAEDDVGRVWVLADPGTPPIGVGLRAWLRARTNVVVPRITDPKRP